MSLNGTPLGALLALAQLTDEQREAFVNRELLGWSQARTAASMGISEQAVRSLLRYADKTLGIVSETTRPVRTTCRGCDGPLDRYTPACRPCSQRRYDRKRAEQRKAA